MAEKTVPAVQDQKQVAPQETTRSSSRYYYPAVDIFEHENELILVADLPGVIKENLNIHVDNNILTVEAAATQQSSGEPIYREFVGGNFYRQFELSEEIDSEKISAELKNGVLTLHLPKTTKEMKMIHVKVS
jgi:HSP20 family molecular chaperone IbpA